MSRHPTKNPPPPIGQLSLTYFDPATWETTRAEAGEWGVDLGLYVEYALRHYYRGKLNKMRLARWRHEQDMKDPDLRRIREYLETEGGKEPEPEFLKKKYLPKSKRRAR